MELPKRGIPSLDGLRAFAVTLVLICHFGNDYDFKDIFNTGDLGVRIFFVISGFLITGILLREIDKAGELNLANFYLRRSLRIFPAFYFYLAVMLLLGAAGFNNLTPFGAVPALTYTSNYWSVASAGYVTSHTWSLAIEEQFYLLWPFILMLVGKQRAFWILTAIVVGSPIARAAIYLYDGGPSALGATYFNLDHIGMGCLLAFARGRLHSVPAYMRALHSRAFICVPLFVAWATCQQNHPSIHRTLFLFLINVAIALCIDRVITRPASAFGSMLNWKPITFVGMLSYSIYLWQQPFSHLHEAQAFYLPPSWQFLAHPAIGLAAIFSCALFSYFLIEQPALRFREAMQQRKTPTAQQIGISP